MKTVFLGEDTWFTIALFLFPGTYDTTNSNTQKLDCIQSRFMLPDSRFVFEKRLPIYLPGLHICLKVSTMEWFLLYGYLNRPNNNHMPRMIRKWLYTLWYAIWLFLLFGIDLTCGIVSSFEDIILRDIFIPHKIGLFSILLSSHIFFSLITSPIFKSI